MFFEITMKLKKAQITILIILMILIIAVGVLFYTISFRDYWTQQSCIDECQHRAYITGSCKWPVEAEENEKNIGGCFIENSRHCGNLRQCDCYCSNQQLIGGCGGVAPQHIQECCERWAEENKIVIPACVGEWEIREGKCGWECD